MAQPGGGVDSARLAWIIHEDRDETTERASRQGFIEESTDAAVWVYREIGDRGKGLAWRGIRRCSRSLMNNPG
jgi:hypothetical protein